MCWQVDTAVIAGTGILPVAKVFAHVLFLFSEFHHSEFWSTGMLGWSGNNQWDVRIRAIEEIMF